MKNAPRDAQEVYMKEIADALDGEADTSGVIAPVTAQEVYVKIIQEKTGEGEA